MLKAVGEDKSSYWNDFVLGLRFFHMEEMCLCNKLPLRIVDPVPSQDGRGLGRGDHFLSYKFIERRIER